MTETKSLAVFIALALAGACSKKASERTESGSAGSANAGSASAAIAAPDAAVAETIPPYTPAAGVPVSIRAAVEAARSSRAAATRAS